MRNKFWSIDKAGNVQDYHQGVIAVIFPSSLEKDKNGNYYINEEKVKQREENAQLIAVSPELLETLKLAILRLEITSTELKERIIDRLHKK